MHDRRRAGLRHVLRQPRADALDGRDLARLVAAPTGRGSGAAGVPGSRSACRSPPARRPRQSTAWISTSASISSSPIRAGARAGVSSAGGTLATITSPCDPLHHVEGRADRRRVLADGQHLGHARGGVPQRAQQPGLAQHVVGARRQRRAGRTAQHELACRRARSGR